jgi:hypothetical protein
LVEVEKFRHMGQLNQDRSTIVVDTSFIGD